MSNFEQDASRDLILRRAKLQDCKSIWLWANDAVTRNASFSTKPISWSEHVIWFDHQLELLPPPLAVAVLKPHGVIAMVRCATHADFAEISLNISPAHRRCGWGARILIKASAYFFQLFGVELLIARIKPTNKPSLRVFEQGGYVAAKGVTLDALAKNSEQLVLMKKRDNLP